jgi:pimeloyl-ACP methyl ester carboxylesterase
MKTSLLRRGVAAVALLVTASLTLSACLYSQIPKGAGDIYQNVPASTDGVPENLVPFYTQELDWKICNTTFQCTTVEVPLDYAHPEDRTIELSVIRSVAMGKRQGSLLTNPGGPGASGVALIRDSLSFAVGKPLRENYDVIGFDPRGVGESTAVSCLSGSEKDSFLYDPYTGALGSEERRTEMDARGQSFAEACAANSDGILPYITTVNAANDLDILRGVLGDEQLNYLGYSYGTFLGASYAQQFPQRAGRLVLDGAIDPSVSGTDVGLTQAAGFESALRAYMSDCITTRECPFTGDVDQALTDLSTLMHTVDASPLPTSDSRTLDGSSLMTAISAAMYNQDNWSYLTQALSGALEGDGSVAMSLADFYNGRVGPGKYEDNSTEAFTAYNCMDYPDEGDSDSAAAEERLRAEAPTIADFWDGPNTCGSWPVAPTGVRAPIVAEGTGPIVVVGTTNDPATPYQWSVNLADQLAQGVLITRVGEGHTGYGKGNNCVDDAVEAYLIDGTTPEDGLRCE